MKLILLLISATLMLQADAFVCYRNGHWYYASSKYSKDECTTCKCIIGGYFSCETKSGCYLTATPPTAKPQRRLPTCPMSVDILAGAKVTPSSDDLLVCPSTGGSGSGEGSGEGTIPNGNVGDNIVIELKKPSNLASLHIIGKSRIGAGVTKYRLEFSEDGNVFHTYAEVNISKQGRSLMFKEPLKVRYLRITVLAYDGQACMDLRLRGCRAKACEVCQYPKLCKLVKSNCKLSAFCGKVPTCSCPAGYYPNRDKKTCKDVNECLKNQGGCSQNCANTPGSFKCECWNGYKLQADGRSCKDINECNITQNGGCQHRCVNTIGSFYCSCKNGYQPKRNDASQCEDVDECAQGACAHKCVNKPGSFNCSCRSGYHLESDGRNCKDTNECSDSKLNKCDQQSTSCQNFLGFYTCPCKSGYGRKDAYTCKVIYCFSLTQSQGIKIQPNSCTQPNSVRVGSECKASCDDGYNRNDGNGEVTLTCQQTGHYNGGLPTCRPKVCPAVQVPQNGMVYPTVCSSMGNTYMKTCTFMCNNGFDLVGNRIFTCTKTGAWNTNTLPVCKQRVTAPSITCMNDITEILDTGKATKDISSIWKKPTANVKDDQISMTPSGFNPNSVPAGVTRVVFTATNSAGQDRCTVRVNIRDIEKPSLVYCPDDIDIKNGKGWAIVSWKEPQFKDNVNKNLELLIQSNGKRSGDVFYQGTINIIYRAFDNARNEQRCTFKVTVTKLVCLVPKIANGYASCFDTPANKLCSVRCFSPSTHVLGHTMYFTSCKDPAVGWSIPFSDCVRFSKKTSASGPCPIGQVPQTGYGANPLYCVNCQKGKYYDNATKLCKSCPSGTTTSNEGAKDKSECK